MKRLRRQRKKRLFVKADVRRLAKRFKTTGIKTGDLVLHTTIYRVLDADYGRKNLTNGVEVATVYPPCEVCSKEGRECIHPHILHTGRFCNFGAMKLVR